MFRSAEHKTLGAKITEVFATVFLMRACALAAVAFFQAVGLISLDFSDNVPLLGVSANALLHHFHLTVNQALASPWVVMGVIVTIVGAPFAEEIAFRWFVCRSCASDTSGNLIPGGKGAGTVLLGSFLVFGVAHGAGYFSLMIQGVGGLWLAMLFFRNGPDLKTAYFSCVAAHSLYNTMIVMETWLF